MGVHAVELEAPGPVGPCVLLTAVLSDLLVRCFRA